MEILDINTNYVESVSVITKVTYLLFLFLTLAIFIERSTEIFMSLVKYLDLKWKGYRLWNNLAERFQTKYDDLIQEQGGRIGDKKLLFRWILWKFVTPEPYTGGKVIVAAKSVRTQYFRVWSRLFSAIIALIFSIVVYKSFDLDLIKILSNVSNTDLLTGLLQFTWVKILITTALLAGGSEPLHHVIKRAERIGENRKQKAS